MENPIFLYFMENGRNFHLICSFFLIFFGLIKGEQCGRPGRPANGTISTSSKFYFPGEKVSYKCLEGFVLFGQEKRVCLEDGTWEGDIPLCDFNLARGKRSLQSKTLWSYTPELAIDGNPDTCSFTPRDPDPRWWQVHLGHKFNVLSIGVTISPGSFQEFTIYIIELLTDNKAFYKPCATFKGTFQTHKALFHCNDGLGHPGQFIYIRDDRVEEEYFGLCEVEVFAFRERIPCGEPGVPINAKVTREGSTAVYTCEKGYILSGNSSLMCSSKGKWEGDEPSCKEIECPAPPNIVNGNTDVVNYRGSYIFGVSVTYLCNPGHVMIGNATSTCTEEGAWSIPPPQCEAVSCGSPPSFANAKFTLINESTYWNGIVVYNCVDGFRFHKDIGSTITTCLDSGEWDLVNITCVPIDFLIAESNVVRRGEARSLNFGVDVETNTKHQNNMSSSILIIALAVVAALLVMTIAVVGILLGRRHFLSGPGSLSPLVQTTDKRQLYLGNAKSENTTVAEDQLPKSLLYQQNIITGNKLMSSIEFFEATLLESPDGSMYNNSFGHEPPYERVKSKSEHSYETIHKKSIVADYGEADGEMSEPKYETVGDKDSIGYETIKNAKDPGYEAVKEIKDPGYESIKAPKQTNYEYIKNKDPGYESVKEHEYEILKEKEHGYETLKKLKSLTTNESKNYNLEVVPDILLNLGEDDSSCKTDSNIPAEILALYAKVDKTKKKIKYSLSTDMLNPPNSPCSAHLSLNFPNSLNSNDSFEENGLPTDISFLSDGGSTGPPSLIARDLINKFNRLSSDDEKMASSRQGSIRSTCHSTTGTLRPLPPLPQ